MKKWKNKQIKLILSQSLETIKFSLNIKMDPQF